MDRKSLFGIIAVMVVILSAGAFALTCGTDYGNTVQPETVEPYISMGWTNYFVESNPYSFFDDTLPGWWVFSHPDGQGAPTMFDNITLVNHYPFERCRLYAGGHNGDYEYIADPVALEKKVFTLYMNGEELYSYNSVPFSEIPSHSYGPTLHIPCGSACNSEELNVTPSAQNGLYAEMDFSLWDFIYYAYYPADPINDPSVDEAKLAAVINGIDSGAYFELKVADTYQFRTKNESYNPDDPNSKPYFYTSRVITKRYTLPRFTNCYHLEGKGKTAITQTLFDIAPDTIGGYCDIIGASSNRAADNELYRIYTIYALLNRFKNGYYKPHISPFYEYFDKLSFYADLGKTGNACGNTIKIEHRVTNEPMGTLYNKVEGKKISLTYGSFTPPPFCADVFTPLDDPQVFATELHDLGHVIANLNNEYIQTNDNGTVPPDMPLENCQPPESTLNQTQDYFYFNNEYFGPPVKGCTSSAMVKSFGGLGDVIIRGDLYYGAFNDLMDNPASDPLSMYNTVSCGYLVSALAGGNPKSHWAKCSPPAMDTLREYWPNVLISRKQGTS